MLAQALPYNRQICDKREIFEYKTCITNKYVVL